MSDLLQFQFFKSRFHVRVQVSRKNSAGKKPEPIGSIKLHRGQVDLSEIEPNLKPEEMVEIDELIFSANFLNVNFGETADHTGKETIRVAMKMQEASNKIATIAKKNDIDYNPHKVMIEAWFKHMKNVERSIDEKTGIHSKILEEYGVSIYD